MVLKWMSLGMGTMFAASAFAYTPEDASREARFADPPASARILPLHHRRPNDLKKADAELDALERQGFGGFAGNVNMGSTYLRSTNDWATLRYTVEAAKKRGMRMWLYDENGYPSGTAGGYVTEGHPEWEARGLLIAATNVPAGASATLAPPPGTFRRACAFPFAGGRIDLAKGVEIPAPAAGASVVWTAPAAPGTWKLLVVSEGPLYEGTHAALNLSKKIPYINLLMKEPTAEFIRITHEAYARELGPDLGRYFDALFTDEPSLMSLWMRPQPWYPLPYCADLPADYAARTGGRDLLADVPALVFETAAGTSPALRHAFWNLVGDRVSRNFMGQIDAWGRTHDMPGGGHLLAEEWLSGHVPLYGDFFRCLRALGQPGTDMLTSIPGEVNWFTCQVAGSAGALNGSRHVMCEVSDHCQKYRPAGDKRPVYQVSTNEINGTLNRLVWGGTDTFTSYYRWAPFKDDEIRQINARVGRCVTLLFEGPNAADVAVLYPSDTLMAGYAPRAGNGAGTTRASSRAIGCIQGVGAALFKGGRAWMFADAPSLAAAEVAPGPVLTTKDLSWRVIVLPGVDTLPEEAMLKLRAFWMAGGTIVAFGAVPVNSTRRFPSEGMTAISREMFGDAALRREPSVKTSPAGGRALFFPSSQTGAAARIVSRLFAPPVEVASGSGGGAPAVAGTSGSGGGAPAVASNPLRVAHRRGHDAGDVFFVMNDENAPWKGRLRLCGGGQAEFWDPVAGTHRPFATDADGFGAVEIPPFGAVLFTTATRADPKRVEFSDADLLPKTGAPIAFTPKALSKGTYVTGAFSAADADGWRRLDVTLTKGGVDTFAFAQLACAPGAFADAKGLALAFRVPEDRATGPSAGIFLATSDGARYYGSAQVSFAEKGETRIFLPFDAFNLFGGAPKGGLAPFSPARITGVSVGFGGYYGDAGEHVVVDFREPLPMVR